MGENISEMEFCKSFMEKSPVKQAWSNRVSQEEVQINDNLPYLNFFFPPDSC